MILLLLPLVSFSRRGFGGVSSSVSTPSGSVQSGGKSAVSDTLPCVGVVNEYRY